MRRVIISSALTALMVFFASMSARADAPHTILYLKADHIEFYYDRFLLEADGNVHLRTSDGFTVTGDAFSMDLKLNRFLVAGHVTLHDASGTVSGAAISDFLDFQRIYFVPVSTEPDRWTFLNGDLAHPAKGRIMPGDVFYFPTITAHPDMTGSGAIVDTKTYVRFTGAVAYVNNLGVPLGSNVISFSSNQYFAQNSLSGATADITWQVAGSPNALTALHLRYDPTNYLYGSIEQHFVGDHEYAIASVNPATRAVKWWNAMLYEKLGDRFQIQSFTQLYTQQYYLNLPRAAQQTTWINANYAFPHSYVQATGQIVNYNILGPGSLEVPNPIGGSLDHPTFVQITANSFQNRIANLPLFEQIYEGYGFAHDTVGAQQYLNGFPQYPALKPVQVPGLQAYGAPCPYQYGVLHPPKYYCPVYTSIYNTVLGFNLFTPSLKLNHPDSPYQEYYFNASLTKQRQWNSLPHYIDNTTTNLTISRQFTRSLHTYIGYQIQNIGDHYINGGYQQCEQSKGLPTTYCPDSFTAFRGLATLRTASFGLTDTPTPDFNISFLVRHHQDFPIPVPGLFAFPQNNILGQPLYNWWLGQPPYDASADVRFKILPHTIADISRTYYWYGNPYRTQFWQQQFVIQLLPI